MNINDYLNKKAQYAQVTNRTRSACGPFIVKIDKDYEKCMPIFNNKSSLTKRAGFISPGMSATGTPGSGPYSVGTYGHNQDQKQKEQNTIDIYESKLTSILHKIENKIPLTSEEIEFIYKYDMKSVKPIQADADEGSKWLDESLRKIYPEIIAINQSNLSTEQKQKKISELLQPIAISAVRIDDPIVYEKFIPVLDKYGISLKEVLTNSINNDDTFRNILESGYFGKGKVPIDRLRYVYHERKGNSYNASERDMLKGVLMDPNGIQNLPFYFSQFNIPLLPGDPKTISKQQFGRLKDELWYALPQQYKENFEHVYGKPFDMLTVGDVQYVLTDLQNKGVPLMEGVDINTPTQSPLRYKEGVPAISNSIDSKTGRTTPLRTEDGRLVVTPTNASNGYTFVDLGNGRVALYNTKSKTFVKASEYYNNIGLFGHINPNNRLVKDGIWSSLVDPTNLRKGKYYRRFEGPFGTRNSFMYMSDKQNGGTPFTTIDHSDNIPTFPALTDKNGNIITDVSAYLEYFTLARLAAQGKASSHAQLRALIPNKNMYGHPTKDQDSTVDKAVTYEDEAYDKDYFSEQHKQEYIAKWQSDRQQYEQRLFQAGYSKKEIDLQLQAFDDIYRVKSPLDCDISDATVVSEGMLIDSKGNATKYPCCYIVKDNKTDQLRTYIPPSIKYEINQLIAQNDVYSKVRLNEIDQSLQKHAIDVLTYEALNTPPKERTPVQKTYIVAAYSRNPKKLMRMVTQSFHEDAQDDPNYNLIDVQRQLASKYIKKDEAGNVMYSKQLLEDALGTQINLPSYSSLHDLNDYGKASSLAYRDEQGQLVDKPRDLYSYNANELQRYYSSYADFFAYGQSAALMNNPNLIAHPLFALTGPYRAFGYNAGRTGATAWPISFAGDAAYDVAVNTPSMAYQIFLNSANMHTAGGDSSDYNFFGSETTKDWPLLPRMGSGLLNTLNSLVDNLAVKPGGMLNVHINDYNPGDFVYDKKFTDLYNLYNTGNTDGSTVGTILGDVAEGGIDVATLAWTGSALKAFNSARMANANMRGALGYALTGSADLAGIRYLANRQMLSGAPQAIIPFYGKNGGLTVGGAVTGLYNAAAGAYTGDIGAMWAIPGTSLFSTGANLLLDSALYGTKYNSQKAWDDSKGKSIGVILNTHNDYNKLITNVPNYSQYLDANAQDQYTTSTKDTSTVQLTKQKNQKYDNKTTDTQNIQDKPFPWQQLLLGSGLAAGGLGLYNLMKDKKKKKKKKKKKNVYDYYEDIQNSYDRY